MMNRRERIILDAVQAWQNRANALLSKNDISSLELIKVSGMSTDILIMLKNGLPLGTQINMRKLNEFFPAAPETMTSYSFPGLWHRMEAKKERRFPGHLKFTVVFYGPTIFGCKTVQNADTRCKSV